jgi:hypothetical protein
MPSVRPGAKLEPQRERDTSATWSYGESEKCLRE